FYAYFADDGIAFNPHPFRVRTVLAGQASTPAPMGAVWAPVYGDVSAAGDLGYAYGNFTASGGAPAAGYYARVWKKDARGDWRIVMDTVSPLPAGVKPQTCQRECAPGSPKDGKTTKKSNACDVSRAVVPPRPATSSR
ncbi:MAG: YybH family protein, partial [Steroidobacteraceae bacterium]